MNRHTPRSGLAAIFKKELYRFFTDRRSVITTILLPGLMIYLIYSGIGVGMTSLISVDEDYVSQIEVVNLPPSIRTLADAAGLELSSITSDETTAAKDALVAKEIDALIIFPSDFDQQLLAVLSAGASTDGNATTVAQPPCVEVYYNSTRMESSQAYGICKSLLESYRDARFTLFTINAGAAEGMVYDLASTQDIAGIVLSTMLPMLIIIFLFSGCISVAPESIAGEKERGTIATLLVTPLKRHELALGKVLALSCIALLAAVSSFIGVIASLPNLIAGSSEMTDVSIYTMTDYLLLGVVILSTVMLFVGIISVLSAFAKTVKEASTLVMPLMIAVIFVAVMGTFSGAQDNLLLFIIPSLNSAQCMAGIFAFSAQPLYVAMTVAANLVYAGVCIVALTRMFNSEYIIFAK